VTLFHLYQPLMSDCGCGSCGRTAPSGELVMNPKVFIGSCPFRKAYPRIAIMQPRHNGRSGKGSVSLDRSTQQHILVQRKVRARFIIIENVQGQNLPQMGPYPYRKSYLDILVMKPAYHYLDEDHDIRNPAENFLAPLDKACRNSGSVTCHSANRDL